MKHSLLIIIGFTATHYEKTDAIKVDTIRAIEYTKDQYDIHKEVIEKD